MTRCADFYEKWKKDPNWCEKSPAAVSRIDNYLSLVDDLEGRGLTPAIIYKNFPESAAREVLKIQDDFQKNLVVSNIEGMIKRGSRVAPSDIKTWAELESPKNNGENRREPLPIGKTDIPVASVKTETPPPQGMTVRDVIPQAPPPSHRVVTLPPNPNIIRYTVDLSRSDLAGIRQMIQRGICEDEEEAVQSCFEEGLNLFMDRIEAQVQEEEEMAE